MYKIDFCYFLHFLDNDDMMSLKRQNLSALVFLINLIHFVSPVVYRSIHLTVVNFTFA